MSRRSRRTRMNYCQDVYRPPQMPLYTHPRENLLNDLHSTQMELQQYKIEQQVQQRVQQQMHHMKQRQLQQQFNNIVPTSLLVNRSSAPETTPVPPNLDVYTIVLFAAFALLSVCAIGCIISLCNVHTRLSNIEQNVQFLFRQIYNV